MSIMHYAATAFSKNGEPTIQVGFASKSLNVKILIKEEIFHFLNERCLYTFALSKLLSTNDLYRQKVELMTLANLRNQQRLTFGS